MPEVGEISRRPEKLQGGGDGAVKSPALPSPRSWVVSFCDSLEAYLNRWAEKPDPKFLEGAFAPVAEGELVQDLPIRGSLPACLNGEYVRNGPNPRFHPAGGYHWFDGDGMLHGVRIKDGQAAYVNRFVRTDRLRQEEHYGAPKFLKIGDLSGYVGIGKVYLEKLRRSLGVINNVNGEGTGNTALVYHANQLMALHEADAPYAVRVLDDGELETVGRQTYEGQLGHAFTAHPKVDLQTGEMFTFGYDLEKKPYVHYRVVSPEGKMSPAVPITIPDPVMMHDFAITEHFAVFLDLPLLFKGEAMITNKVPFVFDTSKKARFGLLPRYATNEAAMKWFELPVHFIFHTANAWDDGDEVVLVACHIPHIQLGGLAKEENEDKHIGTLHEYRFNTKTGEASMRQLADFFSDFPRINESYTARKQRFVYCSVMKMTRIVGVAKYDLSLEPRVEKLNEPRVGGTCVGYFPHGAGRFGSEPVFVPKVPGFDGPEDDGYLLNFVHDEVTGKSEMVVIDAKTMAAEPVGVVSLPRRVPCGFHGIFVSDAQLNNQKTAPVQTGENMSDRQPLLA